MLKNKETKFKSSILFIFFYLSWLLVLIYQGPVYIMFIEESQCSYIPNFPVLCSLSHALGLLISGFLIKNAQSALHTIQIGSLLSITYYITFFFGYSSISDYITLLYAFLAGIIIGASGYWMKKDILLSKLEKPFAFIIIGTHLSALLTNAVSELSTSLVGIAISSFFLLCAVYFSFHLTVEEPNSFNIHEDDYTVPRHTKSSLIVILIVFTFIVSMNSSFLYDYTLTSDDIFPVFSGFYSMIPYSICIILVLHFRKKMLLSKTMTIVALFMGISYILFSILPETYLSYFIINTFFICGCAIGDVCLWCTIRIYLSECKNPVKVNGIWSALNIFSFMIGQLLFMLCTKLSLPKYMTCNLSVFSIFICLGLLTLLQNSSPSKSTETSAAQENEDSYAEYLKDSLTKQEINILTHIVAGKTQKEIGELLGLSENTIKFHTKNIYSKLDIHSKQELKDYCRKLKEESKH